MIIIIFLISAHFIWTSKLNNICHVGYLRTSEIELLVKKCVLVRQVKIARHSLAIY